MSYLFHVDILAELWKEDISMRKTIAILFLLCLLMLSFQALADSATRYIISPNGKTVNIRSGPGSSHSVVTRVKSGTEVEYDGEEDGWCRVRYQGKTGYVDASFVFTSPQKTATPDTGSALGTLAYVTSPNGKPVNLRSGPGRTYAEVGEAAVGKDVTLLTRGNIWSKIRIDGSECYIMTKFLSSSKPSITAAPTAAPAVSHTAYVVSTNGAGVRVRKGAGTTYSVVGELGYGTKVQVDGTKGSWSHVSSDTVTGYIMTRYLTVEKPDPYATATPKATEAISEKAYVTSGNGKSVNVRSAGKSGAKVIATVEVGTQVTVTQRGKSWSQVTGEFGTGYILNTYLSSTKPEITPVPDETPYPSFTAYVYSSNGKSVRMRQRASASARAVTALEVGTEVTVIGELGNWYKVKAGTKEGYMMKTYISETEPVTEEEAKVTPVWIPNKGSRVYLASSSERIVRTYASQESKRADGKAFPVGTPATVKAVEEGWVELSVAGQTCYLPLRSVASSAASAIPGSAKRLINYLKSSEGTVEVRRAKLHDTGSLGNFLTGTGVIVMSRNADEGWAYIQVGTTKGYVDLTNLSNRP